MQRNEAVLCLSSWSLAAIASDLIGQLTVRLGTMINGRRFRDLSCCRVTSYDHALSGLVLIKHII